MMDTIRLAGFMAAHAIAQVAQGKSLTVPLLMIEKADGATQFIQVQGKSSQEAVMKAEQMMMKQVPGAQRAVMAFEAYLNLPPGRTDAIFVGGCWYAPAPGGIKLAVPFRAAGK